MTEQIHSRPPLKVLFGGTQPSGPKLWLQRDSRRSIWRGFMRPNEPKSDEAERPMDEQQQVRPEGEEATNPIDDKQSDLDVPGGKGIIRE